jgi:hypothetical protein
MFASILSYIVYSWYVIKKTVAYPFTCCNAYGIPSSSFDKYRSAPNTIDAVKKRALCVGLNYPGTNCELKGCVNDMRCIRNMLKERYNYADANIRILADQGDFEKPTLEAILSGFQWLLEGATAGDHLIFAYSGHGTHVIDTNGDESNGRDEAIVTQSGLIVDDCIFEKLISQVPLGVNLTCFFDCCHSGTMADLKYTFSLDEKDSQKINLTTEHTCDVEGNVTCWSGCLDAQLAADSQFTGKWMRKPDGQLSFEWGDGNGAFTWHMLQALKRANYKITCDQLLKAVTQNLTRAKFTQKCTFSCSNESMLKLPFVL